MKLTNTESVGDTSLKILIYGASGHGKTTLAGTIEEPTLIISAEAGLLPLRGKKIDVIDLSVDEAGAIVPKEKRVDRLLEAYKYIQTPEAKKKFKWIFIDSLTEISQNLVEKLYQEFPERKDSLVLYGENSKRMRGLIKAFRDLPMYNVVFTALPNVEKDADNRMITTISMVGKIASTLPAFFDEVFYLQIIKDEAGVDQRYLTTQGTDRYVAKDRSGALARLEAPSLQKIALKIRAKNQPVTQEKTDVRPQ